MIFVSAFVFFCLYIYLFFFFFFFNDTATTEIYTLSLHDALPIYPCLWRSRFLPGSDQGGRGWPYRAGHAARSEEHTSELQSQFHLVCRLLLEKKKKKQKTQNIKQINNKIYK